MKQRKVHFSDRKKVEPLAFPSAGATDIAENDIRRRAYELYEKRGLVDGHDVDDWLQAEREVRKGRAAA